MKLTARVIDGTYDDGIGDVPIFYKDKEVGTGRVDRYGNCTFDLTHPELENLLSEGCRSSVSLGCVLKLSEA